MAYLLMTISCSNQSQTPYRGATSGLPGSCSWLGYGIDRVLLTGEAGQEVTLAKSLVAASLLCQGTPIISQDVTATPAMAHFVSTLTRFRAAHAGLLQPPGFQSDRLLSWHGATWGRADLMQVTRPCAFVSPLDTCSLHQQGERHVTHTSLPSDFASCLPVVLAGTVSS